MTRREKRKPGRPKLPKGQIKGRALPAVRLDANDLQLVVSAARAAGKDLSEWIRQSLRCTAEEQMYQRTLHEAMRIVLTGLPNQTATSSKLIEIIERRGLYLRKDGLAARASQISARARKYPNLFVLESSGRILLNSSAAAGGLCQ